MHLKHKTEPRLVSLLAAPMQMHGRMYVCVCCVCFCLLCARAFYMLVWAMLGKEYVRGPVTSIWKHAHVEKLAPTSAPQQDVDRTSAFAQLCNTRTDSSSIPRSNDLETTCISLSPESPHTLPAAHPGCPPVRSLQARIPKRHQCANGWVHDPVQQELLWPVPRHSKHCCGNHCAGAECEHLTASQPGPEPAQPRRCGACAPGMCA